MSYDYPDGYPQENYGDVQVQTQRRRRRVRRQYPRPPRQRRTMSIVMLLALSVIALYVTNGPVDFGIEAVQTPQTEVAPVVPETPPITTPKTPGFLFRPPSVGFDAPQFSQLGTTLAVVEFERIVRDEHFELFRNLSFEESGDKIADMQIQFFNGYAMEGGPNGLAMMEEAGANLQLAAETDQRAADIRASLIEGLVTVGNTMELSIANIPYTGNTISALEKLGAWDEAAKLETKAGQAIVKEIEALEQAKEAEAAALESLGPPGALDTGEQVTQPSAGAEAETVPTGEAQSVELPGTTPDENLGPTGEPNNVPYPSPEPGGAPEHERAPSPEMLQDGPDQTYPRDPGNDTPPMFAPPVVELLQYNQGITPAGVVILLRDFWNFLNQIPVDTTWHVIDVQDVDGEIDAGGRYEIVYNLKRLILAENADGSGYRHEYILIWQGPIPYKIGDTMENCTLSSFALKYLQDINKK
jgi:hypothetical protein